MLAVSLSTYNFAHRKDYTPANKLLDCYCYLQINMAHYILRVWVFNIIIVSVLTEESVNRQFR